MGDKIESKKIAEEASVNVIPGYTKAIKDEKEAVKIAKEIGYPVMLKASAGGGGKGMRVVNSDDECVDGFQRAKNESKASFGDDRIFAEKFITEPHHIEIQILADKKGNAIFLGARVCSFQRSHQNVVEEAPSPFINDQTRQEMGAQAIALAKAVDYESAGTVEFIVDKNQNFYFLEMNTRIQVEHPVTEMITGFDIVKAQIKIALGINYDLDQRLITFKGHSIECRINAEDPETFEPCPGKITKMHTAGGFGIRYDSHIYGGYNVSPFYDSLLAKIITQANSRKTAIKRMLSALDEFYVEGIKTCLLYTSPSPRDLSTSRMPSSA